MVASANLLLLLGLLALSAQLPGAKAKERAGYCVNVPVPPTSPSGKGSCTKCHIDTECPPKKKCCGSDCGNTCQTPEPDLCRLPPVTGICKAHMPKFYYNWKSKSCEEFIYGGCLGNLNRFDTKEECRRACGGKGRPSRAVGECPPPQGEGACVEQCESDEFCGQGEKCCSNGCGHVCTKVTSGAS